MRGCPRGFIQCPHYIRQTLAIERQPGGLLDHGTEAALWRSALHGRARGPLSDGSTAATKKPPRGQAGRPFSSAPWQAERMTAECVQREARSSAELQQVCLRALKQCPGFERVDAIVIQPRDSAMGAANWTVAAIRPRVDNRYLRGARETIGFLQKTYQLNPSEAQLRNGRRR